MSISNNALIFYHTYTIESKKKSVYFTDFSIKTSFSLEYRDGFERLLGLFNSCLGCGRAAAVMKKALNLSDQGFSRLESCASAIM